MFYNCKFGGEYRIALLEYWRTFHKAVVPYQRDNLFDVGLNKKTSIFIKKKKKKIWRYFLLILEQIFSLEYFEKSTSYNALWAFKTYWEISKMVGFRGSFDFENAFEIFVWK